MIKTGQDFVLVLNEVYKPNTMIETKFGQYDLAFKTDEYGLAKLLFIGKKDNQSKVKGERFTRQAKGQWDHKGKTL